MTIGAPSTSQCRNLNPELLGPKHQAGVGAVLNLGDGVGVYGRANLLLPGFLSISRLWHLTLTPLITKAVRPTS